MRKDLLEKQAAMKASQPTKRRGRPLKRRKANRPRINELPMTDRNLQRDMRLFAAHRMVSRGVPLEAIAASLKHKYGEPVTTEAIGRWIKAGRPFDLSALDTEGKSFEL